MYKEPEYCFNCENEATHFVDWRISEKFDIKRTYMCRTCLNAFEFGQCTIEGAQSIEALTD
jgi:transcriptional regulator NrdR family protein